MNLEMRSLVKVVRGPYWGVFGLVKSGANGWYRVELRIKDRRGGTYRRVQSFERGSVQPA